MFKTPLVFALCLVAAGCAGSLSGEAADTPSNRLLPPGAAVTVMPEETIRAAKPRIVYTDAPSMLSPTFDYVGYPLPALSDDLAQRMPDPVNLEAPGAYLRIDALPGIAPHGTVLKDLASQVCPAISKGMVRTRHDQDDSWRERLHEVVILDDNDQTHVRKGVCRLQRDIADPTLVFRLVGEWDEYADAMVRRRIDAISETLRLVKEE